MSDSKAWCPQCKQEVSFVKSAGVSRCPVCGVQFELAPPVLSSAAYEKPESPGRSFLIALGKAFLVVCVLALVGLAVLYAGCAIVLKGI